MSETRQKQLHLCNLGITVSALYNELSGLWDVGLAVMSPVDRVAKHLMDDKDPWDMHVGAAIASGRARMLSLLSRRRRSTALRGSLLEATLDQLFDELRREDEALLFILSNVAKANPSEQMLALCAGTARAMRAVSIVQIPLGRTWDRRCALVFGAVSALDALQHEADGVPVTAVG